MSEFQTPPHKTEIALFGPELAMEALQANPAAIVILTADARPVFANRAVEDIFGCTPEQVMNSEVALHDLIHPQDQERVQQEMAKLQTEKKVEVRYRVIKPDGTSGWVTETRQLAENGDIFMFIGDNLPVLGIVSGSVAHELNNTLTSIGGYAELANFEHPSKDLDTVIQETDKATKAVANLMQMKETGQVRFVEGHPSILDLKTPKAQEK